MIALAPASYALAEPLFAGYAHMRHAIWAVFEGRQAGAVFVDDARVPTAAVVWSQDCYLGGQPGGSPGDDLFAQQAAALVRQRGVVRGRDTYVFGSDPRWLDVMAPLLAIDGARRVLRSTFCFDVDRWRARHAAWRQRIPPGCCVAPLDARLADYPGIHSLWGSVERFLALGFGYAVLRDGQRVTKAQSVFIGDGQVELGVDTLPAHRRRGYATLAACACIEQALQRGLTPGWGAYDNPPSVALAQHLGFKPLPDWPLLRVPGRLSA